MLRYLETFYRHRALLVLPLVVSLVAGIGYVFTQPRQYQATARVWIDRSSLTPQDPTTQYLTPADAQSNVLDELLKSQAFAAAVDKRAGLGDDMAARVRYAGPTAIDRLKALLHGHLHAPPVAPPTAKDRTTWVYQSISKDSLVVVTGPNVLTVTYKYVDPQMAAKTLQAVLDQFIAEIETGNQTQADAEVGFYQKQVKTAEAALVVADNKVYAYLGAHPDQNTPNAIPDQTLSQLRRDDDLARQRYQALLTKLDAAQLSAAVAASSAPTGFRVLDAPIPPDRPVSDLKVYLTAGGGSLAAGLFVALLILLLLTASDTSLRHAREVGPALGLRVVGVVPSLAR